MRIVGGIWGGRRLVAPKGTDTRPTSDRAREAVFSILEARHPESLSAGVVLDAFAGTGALALEALSRGAGRALAVESDPAALAALRSNVESLGATECTVVRGDVFHLVRRGRVGQEPFTLLLLDPPYRIEPVLVKGLLEGLSAAGLIQDDAVVVYEHATGTQIDWPEGFEPATSKRYGDTSVSLAVYGGEPECRP